MADLRRLTLLFQALAARDWHAADRAAREIAIGEDQIGHRMASRRLLGALQSRAQDATLPDWPRIESHSSTGQAQWLTGALKSLPSDTTLEAVRLQAEARVEVLGVVEEWRRRDALSSRGLARRTKLLFHGPPGCGKSITARALGRELGLPIYVVRFDAVVGGYLGQTALHLRQLFRFAESTPSVILIDEVDALGKQRGNPLDVGELDRVVIALLQELEHTTPAGLLIATSNLASELDAALWRRFDQVIEFPAPTKAGLRAFAAERATARGVSVSERLRAQIRVAKSYADVERSIASEERRLVLKGADSD